MELVILLIALYIATVWVILILTRKIFAAAKAMRIPPALASIVTVVGLVYVSCLIPGMFGMLFTRTAWCLFILLAVAGSLLVPRLSTQNPMAPATLEGGQGARSIDFTLIVFGLLGAIPVLDYLRWTLPSSLLNPDSALQWDTVSYHLPGFIEFSQHHTLWSLDGPYQSYSFGFELIGNFLSQPFHAHWGLIIANLLAIILLVIAIAAAARILVPSLPTTRVANWLPGAVLAFWPSASGVLYSDETVTGFRVRSNASEHLRAVIPAGYELKMGG
ncbi:hypothetical protein [Candidatus Thiodictyon syntrophicum]|uniref:hypothetical protein n=1 Tax=Candidatus Thiodictyon syntrophicum TaxID=1166950 RepID=UPI0012FD1F55|nr:hypothetical protein [Candidatus Thiodictyon syntrophicum]